MGMEDMGREVYVGIDEERRRSAADAEQEQKERIWSGKKDWGT